MSNNSKIILGIIALVFAIGLIYYVTGQRKEASVAAISSFADCIGAGYPIMQSFPARCTTPDGRIFTEEVASPILPPAVAPSNPPTPPGPNAPVACTLEAKLCPDGTYVGRVPPSCEFAQCGSK